MQTQTTTATLEAPNTDRRALLRLPITLDVPWEVACELFRATFPVTSHEDDGDSIDPIASETLSEAILALVLETLDFAPAAERLRARAQANRSPAATTIDNAASHEEAA